MAFAIEDIQYVLGEKVINLADQNDKYDRLLVQTGIPAVYESSLNAMELAEKAANKILSSHKGRIDALIFVTQSPSYFLPANSCVLHDRLNLNPGSLVFDYNQGCSGFVQSLFVADSLMTRFDKILLVCADTYRKKLKPEDRSTKAVFSDGASAILLSSKKQFEIDYSIHFTKGSERNLLYQSTSKKENDGYLHMAGRDVWLFTRRYVVPQINSVLANYHDGEVKNIFMHQASRLVVDGIAERLSTTPDCILKNFDKVGNTVSSSIPILIKQNINKLFNGLSILAGFGVGLTSTTMALKPL